MKYFAHYNLLRRTPLKILLISSVLPRNRTSGALILYRHLSQFPDLKLVIATSSSSEEIFLGDIIEICSNSLLKRLTKTRLFLWVNDLFFCINPFLNYKKLEDYIKNNPIDLILTVAHKLDWIVAQKVSKKFNIPLVSIFHDWLPEQTLVHAWSRKIVEHRFKQLYQDSSLAFCVSKEMCQLLGSHPNAQVLYPIPDSLTTVEKCQVPASPEELFKVVYAGLLSGNMATMLQELSTTLPKVKGLQLKLYGRQPKWSYEIIQQLKEQDIYSGFVPRDVLTQELKSANALLVTISFDQKNRRWAETCFPSKLIEYCKFGKPIIVWGPDYSAAVNWSRKYNSALTVTSPLSQDLVGVIEQLSNQPDEQRRLGDKALEMAQGMFNPEVIQKQFIENLYKVATYN